MKKTLLISTIFLISLLNISCATNFRKKYSDNYIKKSEELITQILTESSDCNCIILSNLNLSMTKEKKDKILMNLNLPNKEILEKSIQLAENYQLTKEVIGENVQIITRKKLDELREENKRGMKYWNWMRENCPNGSRIISKPIFNEKLNLACIFIGRNRGVLNGHGGTYIYKFENGVWKSINAFDMWLS